MGMLPAPAPERRRRPLALRPCLNADASCARRPRPPLLMAAAMDMSHMDKGRPPT